MKKIIRIALLLIFVVVPAISQAADKVVVIPLMTKNHGEGELFISAPFFREVTPFVGSSWEENGMILNPNGAGWWIAPLDLPVGVIITSLELYWKNNAQRTNPCTVSLNMFNLQSGHGLDFINMTSSNSELGVQSITTNPFRFEITTDFKVAVRVYLGHSDKWLIGVKVRYGY